MKVELTQEQRQCLQQMDNFLQQFIDRETMLAKDYLAKYRHTPSCEDSAVKLRWAIQDYFNR